MDCWYYGLKYGADLSLSSLRLTHPTRSYIHCTHSTSSWLPHHIHSRYRSRFLHPQRLTHPRTPTLPLLAQVYYWSLFQLHLSPAMSGLFGKLEGMLEGQGQSSGSQSSGGSGGGGGYNSQLDSAEPYIQKAESYIENTGGSDGMLFKAEQAFKSWSDHTNQRTLTRLMDERNSTLVAERCQFGLLTLTYCHCMFVVMLTGIRSDRRERAVALVDNMAGRAVAAAAAASTEDREDRVGLEDREVATMVAEGRVRAMAAQADSQVDTAAGRQEVAEVVVLVAMAAARVATVEERVVAEADMEEAEAEAAVEAEVEGEVVAEDTAVVNRAVVVGMVGAARATMVAVAVAVAAVKETMVVVPVAVWVVVWVAAQVVVADTAEEAVVATMAAVVQAAGAVMEAVAVAEAATMAVIRPRRTTPEQVTPTRPMTIRSTTRRCRAAEVVAEAATATPGPAAAVVATPAAVLAAATVVEAAVRAVEDTVVLAVAMTAASSHLTTASTTILRVHHPMTMTARAVDTVAAAVAGIAEAVVVVVAAAMAAVVSTEPLAIVSATQRTAALL